jgi:hypothetical protein
MFSRLIIALCFCILMSVSSEAGPRLSASEIRALAPGEYVGTWKAKRKLHIVFNANGTIHGSMSGFRYGGKWYVSGQNLCIVYRILTVEKTKCGAIRRQGPWLVGYYNKKGVPRIRLRAAASAANLNALGDSMRTSFTGARTAEQI